MPCGFSSFGRAPPCQGGGGGFEPRNPLQIKTQKRIQEIVPNLRFLLLFRGIFALLRLNFIVCDKKSLSFEGVCDFSGWAIFVFVKIVGFIKIIAIIKILFLNGEIVKM